MMSRKSESLFAAILVACAAATAQAQSVIVIGDFDGLPNNTASPQGWTGQNAATTASFNSPPAPAGVATTGTGAMSLAAGTNFVWAVRLDNGARPTLGADLLSNPLLKMDVTWITSQWVDSTPADTTDNWAKWEKIAINDNTGWQEVSMTAASDPVNPSFPGSWDSVNFGAAHTRTLTYDTRIADGGAPMAIDPAGFVQLWIATNMSATSFPQGSRFWVDNIRLEQIPEPGTLALLAMGGSALAMIRRRHRRG
jgi:hypothetical protein